MFYASSYIGLLPFGVYGAIHTNLPVVSLESGTVKGVQCPSTNVGSYLSIPYGQAPTGELRFSAPRPNTTWLSTTEPFDATKQGPNCIQFGAGSEPGPQSEDCLTLNVFAPLNATSASALPVKAWIFGGSNEQGGISDPLYTGCFAARDSVMVAINYRLGPLGWLALESAGLSGNFGYQDQLLALEWVRDNIASFGGDPNRVLLFGQSAGALDVRNIASLERGSSLISTAAIESGDLGDISTIQAAKKRNSDFVELLKCTVTDPTCIRKVSVDQLEDAYNTQNAQSSGDESDWGPVIDGTVIATRPAGVRVPSIIGTVSNEGSYFVFELFGSGENLVESNYTAFLHSQFGPLATKIEAQYPLSNFSSYGNSSVFQAMSTVITDYSFKCPAFENLKASSARGIPVWTYEFAHSPSCDWFYGLPNVPSVLRKLGPCHTAEIPFVMGVTDNLPPPNGTCNFSAAEKQLSTFMLNAWTSMAATQEPVKDAALWPAWEVEYSQGIVFNRTARVTTVDYSMCPFWDDIAAQMSTSTN